MPYQELDGITSADIAFEAWESTLEGCMKEAIDALMHVMVVDMNKIERKVSRTFEIISDERELKSAAPDLMYQLLQKFLYYKDAEQLLLRVQRKEDIKLFPLSAKDLKAGTEFKLRVLASGDVIDSVNQELRTDVKGVTFHRFQVEQGPQGWSALVVVDT